MADLNIAASEVSLASGSVETAVAYEAIAAGEVVYRGSDGKARLSYANASGKDAVNGIAVCSAAAGQYVSWARTGSVVTLGATAAPAVGTIYVLSRNAGKICPAADITTGDKVTILGVGAEGNTLKVSIFRSEVTK